MRVLFDDGTSVSVKKLSLTQWRQFMAVFLAHSPDAMHAWDLMSCVRGPDTPSERPDMPQSEFKSAYQGRRRRKYQTIEVIRNAMFYGTIGGGARFHSDSKVTLPDQRKWDHFDRHVATGAHILGLKIEEKTDE